jgi:sarcosine oxidase subunit gamma
VRGKGLDLVWAGPDRYLAITAGSADDATRLRETCCDTAAIIDQSDGWFTLRLTGPCVRQTLAKGVSIDLHPRIFMPGETALVQFSHLQLQLTLVDGSPTFDLMAPRAAAGDVWSWLVASAGEFGLEMDRLPAAIATADGGTGDPREA